MITLLGCNVNALEITKQITNSSVESFFEVGERGQNGREERKKDRTQREVCGRENGGDTGRTQHIDFPTGKEFQSITTSPFVLKFSIL